MVKLSLLIILFISVFTSPKRFEMENDSLNCILKDKKLSFDGFEYKGSNKVQDVRIWYSYGARDYKKWKKSRTEENAKSVKKYLNRVVVLDPNGEIKSRRGTPYLKGAFEKLTQIALSENNMETLEVLLARGLKYKPNSKKLNRFAGMYFTSKQMSRCAIDYFETFIANTKMKESNKAFLLGYRKRVIDLYVGLNVSEGGIKACDEYLTIDPDDEEVKQIKVNLVGDPEKVLALYLSELEKTPENYDLIAKAGRLAGRLEDDETAIKLLKKHLSKYPDHQSNKDMLTKILFRNEDFSGVITYGVGSIDRNIRKYVIKAYGEKGQFKKAYTLAQKVQQSDKSQGLFLKGQVYEAAAEAAKQKYAKKAYEWRLLYRLAYIEYDRVNDSRKSNIHGLIPTKGDIFLKNKRVKPNAGNYSSWITWEKAYNKEVFGPDN